MFCSKCGKQIDEEAIMCVYCGVPTLNYTQGNNQPPPTVTLNIPSQSKSSSKLKCKKCGGNNIIVSSEQTSGKTSGKTEHRRNGCAYHLMRLISILCTCGVYLILECLFGRRKGTSKSKSKSKFKNETTAFCQDCGKKWRIGGFRLF